jgi:RecA-family ATPase
MSATSAISEAEFEQRRARERFQRLNTNTIMAMQFEPIRWVVKDYVPEGLTVLAGRQKLGKTWLAMDFAIAVACGGFAMGTIDCDQGDVLYIDLENGLRRIQNRINMLFPSQHNRPDLSRLEWLGEAPDLNQGLIRELDRWRAMVADARLVVIDVLQRVKPAGKAGQTSYESDYDAMAPLQRWATENRVGVVCLHHTRKGGAEDPLEALSGSNGLSACADTTLLLDRDGNGITLYVRGRDVEEKESALSFAGGHWTLTGEASDVRRSAQRNAILAALGSATEAMSPTELSDVTGMRAGNVRKLLMGMVAVGEVTKVERGRYRLAE